MYAGGGHVSRRVSRRVSRWAERLGAGRATGRQGRDRCANLARARGCRRLCEYVVIQYETQFEHHTATETVTPMLDKDGAWKVSGYFIN
jgi:hypothetical protein